MTAMFSLSSQLFCRELWTVVQSLARTSDR